MKLKSGVKLGNLQPQTVLAMVICEPILNKYKQEVVLTSVCDGKHSDRNSKHYLGFAFDVRTWNITDQTSCVKELQEALGDEFYIKLETDHIHIQWNGSVFY